MLPSAAANRPLALGVPAVSGFGSLDEHQQANPRCTPMRLAVPNYLFIDDHCVDPGDPELGTWSREALETMNARFSERLEEAFRLGLENRESAAGQVKFPTSPIMKAAAAAPLASVEA